ncbi:MAG: small-conductance mechanosensitive channel [Burkholderiaceae bacterium]|jgi:small-conductance mechanosensitive channel
MQNQEENLIAPRQLRNAAIESATQAIQIARQHHASVGQHRAMRRLTAGPFVIVQVLLLPALFCSWLLIGEPLILSFWNDCIQFWLTRLDIPLQARQQTGAMSTLHFGWIGAANASYMPSFTTKLGSALATFVVFALTSNMSKDRLPLQYLLRIVCVVQALALLFFWYAPSQFPYSLPDHMRDIISMGSVLMLAIPVMLAIGYYLLDVSLTLKIANTVFMLSYFILMIPHKVVLHTLILYKMSLLYMPVLYICFGAVFDMLLFVALYSWAISLVPERVTG